MDINTYKGRIYKLRMKKGKEVYRKLRKLKDLGVNVKPILEDTLEAFKTNMRAGFRARQSQGEPPIAWKRLSKKYANWKFKKKGIRIANLVLSGRLKSAVNGGPGWYQKISKKRLEFGIRGIPYAARHNYGDKTKVKGSMPKREYFLDKGKLPKAVINYMYGQIEKKFKELK